MFRSFLLKLLWILVSTEKMYSVIVPTMWRARELAAMMPELLADPIVGEFIVVDNAKEFCHAGAKKILEHSKIVYLPQKKNIYVNPAWNLAMKKAKHEKILLLSDDVAFHPDLLRKLDPFLTEKIGIVGPHPSTINLPLDQGIIRNKDPVLTPALGAIPMVGFGMAMFFHRAAYDPIPDQLKIFFGDNWLFGVNVLRRKVPNYYMTSIDFHSRIRTTSASTEFKESHEAEHAVVEEIMDREFGWGIYRKREEMFRTNAWWRDEKVKRDLPPDASLLAHK